MDEKLDLLHFLMDGFENGEPDAPTIEELLFLANKWDKEHVELEKDAKNPVGRGKTASSHTSL